MLTISLQCLKTATDHQFFTVEGRYSQIKTLISPLKLLFHWELLNFAKDNTDKLEIVDTEEIEEVNFVLLFL